MNHDMPFCSCCVFTLSDNLQHPFKYIYFLNSTISVLVFSKGDVCGLCGNFNENGKDELTTQGNLLTTNIIEFVDSWKLSNQCLDTKPDFNPCVKTPSRRAWAKSICIIIKKDIFKNCHDKVQMKTFSINK